MSTVFLSASIPLADRDPKYYETADVIAIRDSIRALVSVIVPDGRIVFGGHPAITPLIRNLVREMTSNVRHHVVLYQSQFYEASFPPEVADFEEVRLVEASVMGEAASVAKMRIAMISGHAFDVGVFLGGMEGVEQEYEMFRNIHPSKPAYAVASTGAAARVLFDRHMDDQSELLDDLHYLSLFRRLLKK